MKTKPAAAEAVPIISASNEAFERGLMERHAQGKTEPWVLERWLKLDTWRRDEGLPLLLGLDPDHQTFARFVEETPHGDLRTAKIISARWLDWSLVCLSGYRNQRILSSSTEAIDPDDLPSTSLELDALRASLYLLEELWDSGDHAHRNPAAFFIAWAAAKGRAVPWLEWVKKKHLLPSLEGAVEQTGARTGPARSDRAAASPVGGTVKLLKKSALIANHEGGEWRSIRGDLNEASRNGLSKARTELHGMWDENKALAWARSKGKINGNAPPAGCVHKIR